MPFTLALAQAEAVLYDKQANLTRAGQMMAAAAARGAQAILFPEMFLTGYMVWDRVDELAEPLNGPLVHDLAALARQYELLTVCGFPEVCPGARPYNSACIIDADGTVLGAYHKSHLFAEEPQAFTPGEALRTFDTTLGRIGVMICYDTEFPEVARLLAMNGAQLVLAPTANMDPYRQYQAVYLRSRAMENGIYIATTNTVGEAGGYRFFGESAAVAPDGRVLCRGGAGEELLLAAVDFSAVSPTDANLVYLRHRRPDLYGPLARRSRVR